MALDRIEKILEKYFEAQTSIAEEKELKDYFNSPDVAQHLEQYKPMFVYAVQAKQEQFTATIPLKTNKRKSVVWLSVAASVAVLLGVGLFTFNHYNQPEQENLGTINDPEIAFRETQKALAMISESVNKGIGSMGYLNEYEQSKNKIFKK
ncbi:hypothetical protein [Flavobacterium wongokense]|uniref:hypothetical protein n=1 Tax=Flavobacterium wongokense TaxID=2910674 RepID=UPI001F2CC884|nr:hypothetical protein [Flavobacterium sp. WG47]MCF6132821.1 hypothetical protein [Flavobacterium sp. WG47]